MERYNEKERLRDCAWRRDWSYKIRDVYKKVHDILNEESTISGSTYYFFSNYLQIEFRNNAVVFIQLCNNEDIIPIFKNQNLFKLKDIDILELLNPYGTVDMENPEYGYVYQFNMIGLNFWRGSDPIVLQDELKMLEKDSIDYKHEKAFYESEIEKSSYFSTVAVFSNNCYL